MSSTCSNTTIVKFENNNDIKNTIIKKMSDSNRSYQPIKQTESAPSSSSTTSVNKCIKKTKRNSAIHLNNLWSIWYGIFCTAFQAYAAIKCLKRILGG